MKSVLYLSLSLILATANIAKTQSITLPPSGDNQKCSVSQWMGLVSVTVTYNSPDVTGPNGEDRKGKIWGGVVPFGLSDNNFGTVAKMPWRAGANENTTITLSHDVKVEGKPLSAGTYGLHMIPEKEKWTIIFSNNSTAWGSYFYNEKDDALRVDVVPKTTAYTEWLTYDFITKNPESTTLALKWEDLMVPMKIEAEVTAAYLTKIRQELQNSPGFTWQNWVAGVNFCLSKGVNMDEALQWSEYAINAPFIGEKNFTTLSTKSRVLYKLNKKADGDKTVTEAMAESTATMNEIHNFGRQLITDGYPEKALEIFELNRKNHPEDKFATIVGLARGYEAVGKNKLAVKNYRIAAENAPEGQRDYYLGLAGALESKE